MTFAALSLVMTACNTESTEPMVNESSVEVTFSADAAPAVRSSFDGETANLLWSSYDNLGVYAYAGETCAGSSVATIKEEFVGKASADFVTSDLTLGEGAHTFYAYYPELDAAVNAEASKSVVFDIATVQTEEFGKYQVCYAASAEYTSEQLATEKVTFAGGFAPATTVVRVYPVLAADDAAESRELTELTLCADAALAGEASLNLATGEWTPGDGASNGVTVVLAAPLTVTKLRGDYVEFVVLPGAVGKLNVISAADGLKGVKTISSAMAAGQRRNMEVTLGAMAFKEANLVPDDVPTGYAASTSYMTGRDAESNACIFSHNGVKNVVSSEIRYIRLEKSTAQIVCDSQFGNIEAVILKGARSYSGEPERRADIYFGDSAKKACCAVTGDNLYYYPSEACTGFRLTTSASKSVDICQEMIICYTGEVTSSRTVLSLVFHNGIEKQQPFTTTLARVKCSETDGVKLDFSFAQNGNSYGFVLAAPVGDGNKVDLNGTHGLQLRKGPDAYILFPVIPGKKLVSVANTMSSAATEFAAKVTDAAGNDVSGGDAKPMSQDKTTIFTLSGTDASTQYRIAPTVAARDFWSRNLVLVYE